MSFRCAAAAFLLILVPVTSFAQTNEQMSRPTFPEKVWGETTDDLMFGDRGNVKENDSPYNLFMWDSIGRFRLDSNDPATATLRTHVNNCVEHALGTASLK